MYIWQPAKAADYTLSGYVFDEASGEALLGTVIYVKALGKGTTSNEYGFYSVTLPEGEHEIQFSYIGYEKQSIKFSFKENTRKNIRLKSATTQLKEVVITTKDEDKAAVKSTQMSAIKIQMEQIKHLPSLGGEVDIIKVMQLMPGVKRGGEGQTGMYVRGGGADQNLILLDEATVYNVSHLFGFFSVFNNDALKDVSLLKGGFPSQYGGRISSIMDIRMKEGNQEKYSAEGGVGLLSSRLTLQGPVVKDRASFLVSGRRTYIDKVLGAVGLPIPYYFYDLNGKFNYKLSSKDRIYYSAYFGNDVLSEPDLSTNDSLGEAADSSALDFGFKLGNFTNTLRWNHIYNPKLFSNLSLIYTRFRYDINGEFFGNSIFIGSKIRDLGAKLDFDLYQNTLHHLKFGGAFTNHIFRPNVVSSQGVISEAVKSNEGKPINTQEMAAYIQNEQIITPKLTINYGLRISGLITQKKLYAGPEPRFSASYNFTDNNSLKLSYSRMHQYMHLVSSSSVALPTDLWYPVTKNVKPQVADQVAGGYTHYIEKLKSLVTVEAYYKRMNNLIEYRPGAVLLLNDNYEAELLEGRGDSYGLEFFFNKTKGNFTGWVGYTLSWATRNFDELNGGKTYYAKYDRRHDISLVANYNFTPRFTVSAVWVYATGQRLTARTGNYFMPNPSYNDVSLIPIFSGKNEFRFSPSHRLDINFVIKRKPNRKWEGEWNFGAYNVYNRAQPYRVESVMDKETGKYKLVQKGLFGFLPFVAYNFKF